MISLSLHFNPESGPYTVEIQAHKTFGAVIVLDPQFEQASLFFNSHEAAQLVGDALKRAFEIDLATTGKGAAEGGGAAPGPAPATEAT